MLSFADAVRQMSEMSFLIGESNAGELICADMDKTPHLLVSGVTGTGKSVFLHSLLLSLMLRNKSDCLRFILCDSKVVELEQYNKASHLLIPVVVDSRRIISILQWADHEIYRRLNEFAQRKKKSLLAYNDYLREHSPSKAGLPRIVLVVDDLSAIAMQEPSISEHINRIILNGRAAGIHLVLITQAITQKGVREIAKMVPSKVVFLTLTAQESKFLIGNASACQLKSPGNAIFSAAPGSILRTSIIMADYQTSELILSVSKKAGVQYDEDVLEFVEKAAYSCEVN